MFTWITDVISDLPINKVLVVSYSAIIGSVLTLDIDVRTILSILGVLVVNLIALLKWGVKVEKALVRLEERARAVEEKLEHLEEVVMDANFFHRD